MVEKGFKQTEIGLIPEDWEVKKLREVVEIKKGQLITEKTAIPDGIPVIGGGMTISYFHNKPNRTGVTITISASGAYAGYVSIHSKPIFASDCSTISEGEKYDIYFLYFCLLNKQREIYGLQTGGGQPHVYPQQLRDLFIAIPKYKAEQTAIATVLKDTDTLIEKLEQLIAKKRLIKQGAMQQLLKPKKGWEVKKLGDYLDYEQPTKYIVADTKYDNHNQTPVLTAGKSFILGYTNEEFGIYKTLPVIIFDDFTTASKYVDFEFKVKSSAIKILKPKHQANLRFFYELMQTIKFDSTDHKRYWISEYQHIEVKVPKYDEQTRIAQILTDMDSEIEALERQLAKYIQIKQGMMQVLLTGKIRLVKPVRARHTLSHQHA